MSFYLSRIAYVAPIANAVDFDFGDHNYECQIVSAGTGIAGFVSAIFGCNAISAACTLSAVRSYGFYLSRIAYSPPAADAVDFDFGVHNYECRVVSAASNAAGYWFLGQWVTNVLSATSGAIGYMGAPGIVFEDGIVSEDGERWAGFYAPVSAYAAVPIAGVISANGVFVKLLQFDIARHLETILPIATARHVLTELDLAIARHIGFGMISLNTARHILTEFQFSIARHIQDEISLEMARRVYAELECAISRFITSGNELVDSVQGSEKDFTAVGVAPDFTATSISKDFATN